MRGLVDEAQQELGERAKGPVLDIVIVAGQQRIEHYELAAYGTMVELAKAMEETEVADLLAQTLGEEKAQDERLTELTRNALMPAALGEGEDEEEEDEDGDEEEEEEREVEENVPATGKSRRKA